MGPLMDAREAAQYLGISRAHVYKLAQRRQIPAIKIGRCWRFSKQLLDEWFERKGRNLRC